MFKNSAKVLFIATVVVLTGVSVSSGEEDKVFSGPQPGEKLPALPLTGVYDDQAGKEFDPVADADGKPLLVVFVHKITRPGLGMSRGLTAYVESLKDKEANAAIAWLADDKGEAEQFLLRARKSLNVKVPIGISVDGGEGPGVYGLNRNVELTVLVANKGKVVANFALVQPSMSDGVKIAGEIAKAVGEEPPTMEQLQEIAYPGMKARMMQRQRQSRGDARPRGDSTPKRERVKKEGNQDGDE